MCKVESCDHTPEQKRAIERFNSLIESSIKGSQFKLPSVEFANRLKKGTRVFNRKCNPKLVEIFDTNPPKVNINLPK